MTRSDRPLVSIVIPTRNRADYLEKCLTSCFETVEAYGNAEVIVIDGGSTDSSPEIIRKYADRLAYWVSEPDRSVGDAVNKGVAQAKGEIIRIIGDDDENIPEALEPAVRELESRPHVDVLVCHAKVDKEREGGATYETKILQPVGRITFVDLLNLGFIGWPSPEVSLYRKRCFERFGGFDIQWKYMAYWDHWLRVTKQGGIIEAIPLVLADRCLTMVSDSQTGQLDLQIEMNAVPWKHGGLRWLVFAGNRKKNGLGWFANYKINAVTTVLIGRPVEIGRRIRVAQSWVKEWRASR